MNLSIFFFTFLTFILPDNPATHSWIRINVLGYPPEGIKVAVWCSKQNSSLSTFQLIDAQSGQVVYESAGKAFGSYGPFSQTYRLNFSSFTAPGRYYLKANDIQSPVFTIGKEVYKGTADFILNYMRQQRSGYNPFLKDSCHTHDGYTLYGPMPDSTHIDASGGWHDASDYLQYATTSANATYHLLMAYRDFPQVFDDKYSANGLPGKNDRADVLDEARWGLDWLLKMHPRDDWMFNQLADDRDHISLRIPKQDNQYGKGYERPVYFITGRPQQRGKFMNHTTGTSSTAGKFCSAFALGSEILNKSNPDYSKVLMEKAFSAYAYGKRKPGVSQTVSVRSPYIYAEGNWTDDMELAAAKLYALSGKQQSYLEESLQFASQEPITPWLGKDTASHYQWYPFINIGHAELAAQLKGKERETIVSFYRRGIENVWEKSKTNAFFRGVPFIWCSNNLTVAFAIQCYWYRKLTGDSTYSELEQSNIDWILGCNPWGTSMVYGLPSWADTPVDPHSAFTHLKQYPIDGGLVDGPVYTKIFNSLIGLQLTHEDTYAEFQSDLAVYHDDYGDYSTNEPTMDGTASFIYLMASREAENSTSKSNPDMRRYGRGAIISGDTTKKMIALVFTGDTFGEGGETIRKTLKRKGMKASFFLTGNFYCNPSYAKLIQGLKADGHYLGAHSDKHLLYCDWNDRDSLLVTREEFRDDLLANYSAMKSFGISSTDAHYFLPPYEWYNETIASWTTELGFKLVNYSPGTLSHADYTTPEMSSYRTSDKILKSILDKESKSDLNGFILLMHVGTDPKRTDKFYNKLDLLTGKLQREKYKFVKINELLKE